MPEDTEQLIADLQSMGKENMRLRQALNRIATETHTRLYMQDIAREALKRSCPGSDTKPPAKEQLYALQKRR